MTLQARLHAFKADFVAAVVADEVRRLAQRTR